MSRSELLRAIVGATAELAAADFSDCRTAGDIGLAMFLPEELAAGRQDQST